MKATAKRIISLCLTLSVMLGTLFSLTSCLTFFTTIPDTGEGGSGGGTHIGGGETDGGTEKEEGDEEIPEFFPKGDGNIDSADLTSTSKALLSVVRIVSNFEKYSYSSTMSFKKEGSGVIYQLDRAAGDAYIITNYHVVYHGDSITSDKISEDIDLYLYGQEHENYKINATYIGGSLTQDLAVLRVTGSEVLKNSYALAATVGDSEALRPLDTVIAIGNPEGFGISVTSGIVSVDSESLAMLGADGKTALNLRVMRVSAAINEGNSGGGLFDGDGNLVGIVNAKRTGEEVDNIGYAIPINLAKNIADSIIYYCDGTSTALYKCVIGINLEAAVMGLVVDPDSGAITKVERVEISGIVSGCILEGRVGIGDVINSVTVDGVTTPVTRTHHIIDAMYRARVGSVISLSLTRGNIHLTVEVTVPESALTVVK